MSQNTIKTILTALAIGIVGFFVTALLLSPVFSGKIILPQSIHIGVLRIQFYGLIVGIGALSAYWLISTRREQYNISSDDVDKIFLLLAVSGFIGARIYHVISSYQYYLSHPWLVFAVWNGGLGIFGAGLAGLLALWVYTRRNTKYTFFQLLDWLTPGVVLGQLIGRFGNFFNYELYGRATNLPWKMFVPIQFRIPPFESSAFFHPLFLYEAVGSAIILYLVLKLKLRSGYLFLLWVFLYNVMRFLLEFLRVDSVMYGHLRINAFVALFFAAISVLVWYRIKSQNNLTNQANDL